MTDPIDRIDLIISDLEQLKGELLHGQPAVPDVEPHDPDGWIDIPDFSPTIETPVAEHTFHAPEGPKDQRIRGYELTFDIENMVPHPEMPDGIHGLCWIHDGRWKQGTSAYLIWRGTRGVYRLSSLWGLDKLVDADIRDQRTARSVFVRHWGPNNPRRVVGASLGFTPDDGHSQKLLVPELMATRKLIVQLGNPDHRPDGMKEVPSLGWTFTNVRLRLDIS